MAVDDTLARLLRETLERVAPPKGYETLRQKLVNNRPTRDPPTIRESPENTRRWHTAAFNSRAVPGDLARR